MAVVHSTDVVVADDGTSPVGSDEWNAAHVGNDTEPILVEFYNGGSTIATGIYCDYQVPYACTILDWTALAAQSGSIVVDIWKDTYANFPPTVADTITASAKPTITAATKATDSTLTGWSKSIAADDILRFNVDSVTTLTRVLLAITVQKT